MRKFENQLEFVRERLAAVRVADWRAIAEASGVPYGTVYNIAYGKRSKDPSYTNVYAIYGHLKSAGSRYKTRGRRATAPATGGMDMQI